MLQRWGHSLLVNLYPVHRFMRVADNQDMWCTWEFVTAKMCIFFWPDQTWSTSNSQYAAQYNSNISDVGSEFTFEQLGNDLFWNRWTCRTLLQPEDININCISTTLKRKCSQVFFSLTVLVTCGMHCLILLLKHFLWIL